MSLRSDQTQFLSDLSFVIGAPTEFALVLLKSLYLFGVDSEVETPVHIQNKEVKTFSTDGTVAETMLESRTQPVLIEGHSLSWAALFCGGNENILILKRIKSIKGNLL